MPRNRTADQSGTRQAGNAASQDLVLLTLLHLKGPLQKSELARRTGLSHPTVGSALEKLQEAGEVSEAESGWSAVTTTFYVIGIAIKDFVELLPDAGGFKITWQLSGIVTDRAGVETGLEWSNEGEGRDDNTDYEHVLSQVCDAIKTLKKWAGDRDMPIGAVGVEMGGHIDAHDGTVRYAPSFGWFNKPLAKDIEDDVELDTRIENDVNAIALYETFDPDRPARFAVVLVSDAIGGAIVDKKRILHGSSGGAGEIGHIPIAGSTAVCPCSNEGCLQAVASYAAIRAAAIEQKCTESSVRSLVREADTGARVPRKILDDAAQALAYGIVAVQCMVQPEQILISSTAFEQSIFFQTQLKKHVREHQFPSFDIKLHFISTKLPHAAAGAAWSAIIARPRLGSSSSL